MDTWQCWWSKNAQTCFLCYLQHRLTPWSWNMASDLHLYLQRNWNQNAYAQLWVWYSQCTNMAMVSMSLEQHMKIFTYVGPFLESTEEGVRKAEEKGAEVVLKGWCVLWWNLSVQVIFHKVSVSAVIFKNALFFQRWRRAKGISTNLKSSKRNTWSELLKSSRISFVLWHSCDTTDIVCLFLGGK